MTGSKTTESRSTAPKEEAALAAFGFRSTLRWPMPFLGYLIALMLGAAIFQAGEMHVSSAVIGLPLAWLTGWLAPRGFWFLVIPWTGLLAIGFAVGALAG